MKRSLEVFIKGTALWLPIVSLFAMSWFRLELMRHGTTSWDEVCETRVEHGEPELWRYLILTGIVVSFALLVLLGAAVMAQGQMSRLPS